jgi:hypothetical protein
LVGPRSGLDVLDKRNISYAFWDSNPRSSSPYQLCNVCPFSVLRQLGQKETIRPLSYSATTQQTQLPYESLRSEKKKFNFQNQVSWYTSISNKLHSTNYAVDKCRHRHAVLNQTMLQVRSLQGNCKRLMMYLFLISSTTKRQRQSITK